MVNTGMEELIPIVNKLHDVFTQIGPDVQFDLPQIAVVGGQSAGKSSVLENFVGKDFLPRGTGIVTRRPLILQLINSAEEWGEFLHCKGKRFTNFDEIRTEIETDTDRVTGTNRGISNLPINLRVYSPNVLNITLIDLPGLTKNPIGDQPEDIEHQIRDMIMEYISKDTCLILAVTPANVDLGTSDALKLARFADPEGRRTIGVITKLDIMDAGTNASEILQNKVLPLKRGYIGVVNRSQKDIDGRKDIKAAQEAEKKFFQTHPAYKTFALKMGTPYLQRILNEQLTAHIRECLPALRTKLRKEKAVLEKEVEKHHLGDPAFRTKELHNMIHQLQSDFRGAIRGYGNVGTAELSGGVKINYIFHEMFSADLANLSLDEDALRREIAYAVRNCHGIETGIFTPNMAFQTVVKGQIARLEKPSMTCADLVTKEFTKTILGCTEKMKHYPKLCEETEYIISNFIEQNNQACKSILQHLLESEAAYINSKHEEFVGCVRTHTQDTNPTTKSVKGIPEVAPQNLMKGFLYILSNGIIKGGPKCFWFVLTTEALTWYKDESEGEKRFEVLLQGLSIRMDNSAVNRRSNTFMLYYPDGRSVTKENKQLVLSCHRVEDIDSWKSCFLRGGVRQENMTGSEAQFYEPLTSADEMANTTMPSTTSRIESSQSFSDPQLERQVETIRLLVDSYMNIVTRTSRDLVPKIIMNFIIKKTQDFIDSELLPQIYSHDPESLMSASGDELARRDAILRTYKACQESLEIINEVTLATSTSSSLQNGKLNSSGYNGSDGFGVTRSKSPIPKSREDPLLQSGRGRPAPIIPKRPAILTSQERNVSPVPSETPST